MQDLCQIFRVKRRKIWAATLILCLICGWTPTAESISVKLRGKIALVGMISGLAYLTHVLVKSDRRAMEQLEFRLGPPDRVVQFERGFDLWRINYYREQCYLFRNNRFIGKKVLKFPFSCYNTPPNSIERLRWKGRSPEGWKLGRKKYGFNLPIFQSSNFLPVLIDTPVSGNPKWLQPYPLHPLQAPRPVSFDPYPLGDEGLLRSLSS